MSLDLNTISAVCSELKERITGLRIDKILQPGRNLIILNLRGGSDGILKLLISADIAGARVHLTKLSFDNPGSPPMFCMLLRKHLSGACIISVEQPMSERILQFTLKTSSAMGDVSSKKLIIELFGRIPNVILTDGEDLIIDCLRRIGGDGGGKRMILPGLKYQLPEPPVFPKKPESVLPDGISAYLDDKYSIKSKNDIIRSRCADLIKIMKTAQTRVERRLASQRKELKAADEREFLRECGDIIMANLTVIKKGDGMLTADDFYAAGIQETGGETGYPKRNITLDILKTPAENAQLYYRRYTKAKNAAIHLSNQIAKGEHELIYIGSVLDQLERVENASELDEIREELAEAKYIKSKPGTGRNAGMHTGRNTVKNTGKKAGKKKPPASQFMRFTSSTGSEILAGRNNLQNDRLTLKTAHKSDIWLHTQKIHGSHVIIKTNAKPPDQKTLYEAAVIAAYYSAARNDSKVPVDYTEVRYVKKPSGARPGMVIYTDFKTIIAAPGKEIVARLADTNRK